MSCGRCLVPRCTLSSEGECARQCHHGAHLQERIPSRSSAFCTSRQHLQWPSGLRLLRSPANFFILRHDSQRALSPPANLSRIKCSAGAVIVPVKVKGRARDLLKKTLGGRPLPFCGKRPPQCHATLERNGRGTQK